MGSCSIDIVGDVGIGKSALIIGFVQHVFVSDFPPEIEDVYVKLMNVDSSVFRVQISEINCNLDAHLAAVVLRVNTTASDCVVVAYDITNRESFDNAKTWYNNNAASNRAYIGTVLVGLKEDLREQREVSYEEGHITAQSWGASYFEVSTKTSIPKFQENIDSIFIELVRAYSRVTIKPCKYTRTGCCSILVDNIGPETQIGAWEQHPSTSKDLIVQFCVDLPKAALPFINICKQMSLTKELGDEDVIKMAFIRYEKFMKLKVKYPKEILTPTLDIQTIWWSHLIRPEYYKEDCAKVFGEWIDHNIQRDTDSSFLHKTAELYAKEYNEEYIVSYADMKKVDTAKCTSPFRLSVAQVLQDRDWIPNLETNINKTVDQIDEKYLINIVKQYEKFLYIEAKYPQTQNIGPSYAVDIIWHTHMIHPKLYSSDCLRILGKHLYHDPWPTFSDEGQMCRAMDKLWIHEFNESPL